MPDPIRILIQQVWLIGQIERSKWDTFKRDRAVRLLQVWLPEGSFWGHSKLECRPLPVVPLGHDESLSRVSANAVTCCNLRVAICCHLLSMIVNRCELYCRLLPTTADR